MIALSFYTSVRAWSSHLWSPLFWCPRSFSSSSVFCSRVSLWVIRGRDDALFRSLSRCIIDQSNLCRLNLVAEALTWFESAPLLPALTINGDEKGKNGYILYNISIQRSTIPFYVCNICAIYSKIYTCSRSKTQHQMTCWFTDAFCWGENQFHCPWLWSRLSVVDSVFLFEERISSTLLWHRKVAAMFCSSFSPLDVPFFGGIGMILLRDPRVYAAQPVILPLRGSDGCSSRGGNEFPECYDSLLWTPGRIVVTLYLCVSISSPAGLLCSSNSQTSCSSGA